MVIPQTYEQLLQKVKDLESRLRKRNLLFEQLEQIFDCSLDLVGSGNLQGYFTRINSSFQHILGYADAEFLASPFIDFVHKDDRARTQEALAAAADGKQEILIENRYRCKDGSYKWIDWKVSSLVEKAQFIAVGRDITARKQVEERFRLAAEAMSDLIYEWNIEDDSLLWFGDVDSVLGYAPGEFPRTISAWTSLIYPEDLQRMVGAVEHHRTSLEPISYEYRIRKKDGSLRYWSDRAFPILSDEKTQPVKWIGVCKDITENRQSKQALEESEQKYRKMLENLMDVYFETTPGGIILYSSPSGAELSGYPVNELIGSKVDMLFHDPLEYKGLLRELKDNGELRNQELLFRKKSGELYDVSVNADIYADADGQPKRITGTIRDITEQKKLKAQLQRSRKMESMGLMAGGIAHDLNNILSGIVSYPDLLLKDLPVNSPLWRALQTIKDSGHRAADVVADLLTVARGMPTSKSVQNPNRIIQEYLDSREYLKLNEDYPAIVFQVDLDPSVMNIRCSAIHMEKILMNLMLNAAEAISEKGKVTVSTHNRYLEEPLHGYENVTTGEYVLLTVADTGAGISRADIEKIFEPFFTKKVLGRKGTGLGLTVVWNTVQDHDGYINVIRDENGTVFELYFPVCRETVFLAGEKVVQEAQYLGNGARILVVDDEKNQREIASGILIGLQYDVEAVTSGEEAVLYLELHRVDLVVLDMIMPKGMNGLETYEKALSIIPDLKAIITSGYAETQDVKNAQKLGAGKYLKKPYTLQELGLAVSEELKRTPGKADL